MSENGLRLLSPVSPDRLSAAELNLRESDSPNPRRWRPFAGSPVRCHPFSGRPGIWTNPMHLEGYLGMTETESRSLLEQIMLPGTSKSEVLDHVCAQLCFIIIFTSSALYAVA